MASVGKNPYRSSHARKSAVQEHGMESHGRVALVVELYHHLWAATKAAATKAAATKAAASKTAVDGSPGDVGAAGAETAGQVLEGWQGIKIPHTLVFVNNNLVEWYFQGRDGRLLRKSAAKLTLNHALSALLATHASSSGPTGLAPSAASAQLLRGGPSSAASLGGIAGGNRARVGGGAGGGDAPVVAVLLCPSHTDPSHVSARYFTTSQLRAYLMDDRPASKPRIGILQAFVRPYGTHNAVSRVTYSPATATVDVRVNSAQYRDPLVSVHDRLAVFVGPSYMSSLNASHISCSPALTTTVKDATTALVRLLGRYSPHPHTVHKILTYFKVSHSGDVWFLFAGNVVAEANPPPAPQPRASLPGSPLRSPTRIGLAARRRRRAPKENRRKISIARHVVQHAKRKKRSLEASSPRSATEAGSLGGRGDDHESSGSGSDDGKVLVIQAQLDTPSLNRSSEDELVRAETFTRVNSLLNKRRSLLRTQMKKAAVADSRIVALSSQAAHEKRIDTFLKTPHRTQSFVSPRGPSASPPQQQQQHNRGHTHTHRRTSTVGGGSDILRLADLSTSPPRANSPAPSRPLNRSLSAGTFAQVSHSPDRSDLDIYREEKLQAESDLLREIIIQLTRDVRSAQKEQYRAQQEIVAKTMELQRRKRIRRQLEAEIGASDLLYTGPTRNPSSNLATNNSTPVVSQLSLDNIHGGLQSIGRTTSSVFLVQPPAASRSPTSPPLPLSSDQDPPARSSASNPPRSTALFTPKPNRGSQTAW